MFDVCIQVAVNLRPKVRGFGRSECWKIVKHIADLVIIDIGLVLDELISTMITHLFIRVGIGCSPLNVHVIIGSIGFRI